MRRIKWGIVGVLLAVTLVPVSAAAPASAHDGRHRKLPAADRTFIDELVAPLVSSGDYPGIVVSVDIPGRGTFAKGYGVADVRTGRPIDTRDHWRIASNTKTFVATAVLQLVDRHRLRLDDTIDRFVKGIPNGDRITMRHLLGMRSGVFDYTQDPTLIERYVADPTLPGWEAEDVLPFIRAYPPVFAPGERTEYSNSNYILLGLVIERVTRTTVERYLRDHVLRPLGLRATSFPTTPAMPRPFARGYDTTTEPPRDLTRSNPEVPWAAGAMVSTVGDMARWAASGSGDVLLSSRLRQERHAFTPLVDPSVPIGYGLGLLNFGPWYGHNGGIFGYASVAQRHAPSGATIVVVATAMPAPSDASFTVFAGIADHFFPGSIPPLPQR